MPGLGNEGPWEVLPVPRPVHSLQQSPWENDEGWQDERAGGGLALGQEGTRCAAITTEGRGGDRGCQ